MTKKKKYDKTRRDNTQPLTAQTGVRRGVQDLPTDDHTAVNIHTLKDEDNKEDKYDKEEMSLNKKRPYTITHKSN